MLAAAPKVKTSPSPQVLELRFFDVKENVKDVLNEATVPEALSSIHTMSLYTSLLQEYPPSPDTPPTFNSYEELS